MDGAYERPDRRRTRPCVGTSQPSRSAVARRATRRRPGSCSRGSTRSSTPCASAPTSSWWSPRTSPRLARAARASSRPTSPSRRRTVERRPAGRGATWSPRAAVAGAGGRPPTRSTSGATTSWPAAGPVVVLERPRHLGNLGAVVRVAAAADAGGVLVVGDADPWHPTAVRAAAGLHLALARGSPATRLPDDTGTRPIVALDPDGDDLAGGACHGRRCCWSAPNAAGCRPTLLAARRHAGAAADARRRVEPQPRHRGRGRALRRRVPADAGRR